MQRPVKFAKYLPKFGWDPIVLAPQPDVYHTFDESLSKEISDASVRVERIENKGLLKAGKKGVNPSPQNPLTASILKLITSWFFLPDNKKGWINDAVDRGIELVKSESVSTIFATAPPYSNLIAAGKIKERTGVPVVMDLRDDWLKSHLIHYPTSWHYRKMEQMEQETLSAANYLTAVNDYYTEGFKERLGDRCPPTSVIPNGFDRENFENLSPAKDSHTFSILYSGLFYGSRKPDWFLKAVKKLMERNSEFAKKIQLRFQGGLSSEHWKTINNLGLTSVVVDYGYLNHQDAVQNLMNADVLFLTLGDRKNIEAVTPGKVFEYIGTKKPILAFIPKGVTHHLLMNYGAATTVGIKDIDAGAEAIEHLFNMWKKGELPEGDEEFSAHFERSHQTRRLAEILNRFTEG